MTPSMPLDCVVIGTCVADVLVRPVPLEVPIGGGRLFPVDPVEVTTGGIVCNTGIAMRRLGATVEAAAIVGCDLQGREILGHLAAEGVGSSAVESRPDAATSTTAVLIDESGERSFAHHVGAAGMLDLAFLRRHAGLFSRCRYAILGYAGLLPSLEPHLAEAAELLRSAGSRVILETAGSGGSLDDVAAALPLLDVFVPSLDEARRHTGLDHPPAIIARYRSLGSAGIVGVKCGIRGTVISPCAGTVMEIPCIAAPGPVVDTTGAGDSFLAGLVVGLLRELRVPDAARLGAATAAWCVTKSGATAGIRGLAETMQLARL